MPSQAGQEPPEGCTAGEYASYLATLGLNFWGQLNEAQTARLRALYLRESLGRPLVERSTRPAVTADRQGREIVKDEPDQ